MIFKRYAKLTLSIIFFCICYTNDQENIHTNTATEFFPVNKGRKEKNGK